MKIGIVDLWHPYKLSFSWSMAQILSQSHEVTFFANKDFPCTSDDFTLVRLPIDWPEKTTVRDWVAFGERVKQAKPARELIKDLGIPVLYFTFAHPLMPWLKPSSTKALVTAHELDSRQGLTSFVNNSVLRMNAYFSDAIVVMNDAYAVRCSGWGKKVISISHPPFTYAHSFQGAAVGEKRDFLFCGKIRPDKGLDVLLEACRMLKCKGEEFTLTIAGQGDLRTYQGAIEQLKGSVTVINRRLDDDEMLRVLAGHHVLILPYKSVSQSGIAALARDCAVPTLLSDLPKLREQLGEEDEAWIYPSGQTDELSKRMAALLCDKGCIERKKRELLGARVDCKDIKLAFDESLDKL